jgi:hypothetical protein
VTYQGLTDRLLCNSSQLYVRLRSRYYKWKHDVGIEGAQGGGPLTDTITDEALQQYRLNLQLFVDTARNIGSEPILMLQARLVTDDNTAAERAKIGYRIPMLTHSALVAAFKQADRITREVAEEKQVPLIDASTVMTGRRGLFYDHVHTTEGGSQALAQLAAAALQPLLEARRDREMNTARTRELVAPSWLVRPSKIPTRSPNRQATR